MSFNLWYRRLVLLLSLLFVLVVSLIFLKSAAIDFDSKSWFRNQVKIGSEQAPIELIIFEDILCEECKNFFLHIFPLVQKNYINTDLIRFIWVPIEAVGNSDPVITNILCLNQISSQTALDFLKTYFESEETASLEASTHTCPHAPNTKDFLEKNLIMAEKMMQGIVEIPTIFIQGKKLDDVGYLSIQKEIDKLLLEKGLKK